MTIVPRWRAVATSGTVARTSSSRNPWASECRCPGAHPAKSNRPSTGEDWPPPVRVAQSELSNLPPIERSQERSSRASSRRAKYVSSPITAIVATRPSHNRMSPRWPMDARPLITSASVAAAVPAYT